MYDRCVNEAIIKSLFSINSLSLSCHYFPVYHQPTHDTSALRFQLMGREMS